jgi:hypothetical protein
MRDNILNKIYSISLIFFNIILLFNIYNKNKKGQDCCMLNMSILLLIKGFNMYINKLDTEFISLLIIKIGLCLLLVTEFYIFI